MLKHLLLSGWFRAQPFSRYIAFVMLIAPLVAASSNSTPAQSQIAKNTYIKNELDPVSIPITDAEVVNSTHQESLSKVAETKSSTDKSSFDLMSQAAANKPPAVQTDGIESASVEDNAQQTVQIPAEQLLAAKVELAPVKEVSEGNKKELSASQLNLLQKIKTAKLKSSPQENSYPSTLAVAADSPEVPKVLPITKESQPRFSQPKETVGEQLDESEESQQDPIGSSYPIPWNWIMKTHQAISSKSGSGVSYYRSIPLVSPDGRYAVYSRVQLEVKPELYNSRVSSVLFLEDRQTGKLRVVYSTSRNMDTLLKAKADSDDPNREGTIGVLVPVSWSERGERFLARKFEAVFNTSDATDRAVIWDRQNNSTNTVTPAYDRNGHEKIAVLLGWSQTQPDNVLFRAGELGEENWPVFAVSQNGETVIAAEIDRPVTFGKKITQVWANPPIAYR